MTAASPSPPARFATRAASALALAAVFAAWPALADDAAPEFSYAANSAANRWCYGWTPSPGGAFTLYTAKSMDAFGLQYWKRTPDNGSYVSYNPTGLAKTIASGTVIPAGGLNLEPGTSGEYAIVRWTAPVGGTYTVNASFLVRSTSGAAREIAVLHGAEVVFSRWMLPAVHGTVLSTSASLSVAAGDHVDFLVGPADDSNVGDVTGLDATVNREPEPLAAGPVFAFGGERYVPARWKGKAFDSIAFDPVQRRIAGQGKIQDLCGNAISDGPDGGTGLAWDPVSGWFWEVLPDRVVRRWNGATLVDTVFTIPLTFAVPGSGLDTLESVRGIALDSTYAYFVDAGANPGQITSNAWFKFTRAGAPVKSSRSTDLFAHLDLDPDALVDDIVYAPFTSPVFPGRLLVALEHSGIQVLDTQGNFVDRFRWSAQSLLPKNATVRYGKISAFAGLALDPATGNLYLENNDTGDAAVWTRLPRGAAARYALGISGPQLWLLDPVPGCTVPLWEPIPPYANNVFGLAYRSANQTVYTINFSGGDLWRADPRSGVGARVGATGLDNVWGFAYDPGRDVLYAAMETGGAGARRIARLDPASGVASPLPGSIGYATLDLAFSTADSMLYGIASGTPSRLIRISRDTGVGTIVGNTVSTRGLEFDPISGRLIGNDQNRLLSIDPASGAAETLGTFSSGGPFDGIAVIALPVDPVWLAVDGPAPAPVRALRAWPNPSRAAVEVEFALERAAEAGLTVFDVQGRRVRGLGTRRFESGSHVVRWDGDDDARRPVAAGVYFVRVEIARHASVARLVRIR